MLCRMRDTIIIAVACLIAIAGGIWLFMWGNTEPKGTAVPFTILAEGQESGEITMRANYRVKSSAEFSEAWTLVYGPDGPALPSVDFDRYEVLALFDGTHASGGYGIALTAIEDTELSRRVVITHTAPSEECLTTSVITSPYLFASVPRTTLALSREEINKTVVCR